MEKQTWCFTGAQLTFLSAFSLNLFVLNMQRKQAHPSLNFS